jgi:hypothetical protein
MMQIVSACVIRLWMCFCCRKPKVDDEAGIPLVVMPQVDGETNPDRLQTDRLQTDRLQTQNPKTEQGCCERVAFFF